MNRILAMIALCLIVMMPNGWAIVTKQYPNPYRQTIWNNMTDSMHTFGKSPQQAQTIKTRLHHQRTHNRLKAINDARRKAWLNS